MIVHIVMFKFNDENKQENLLMIKEELEALVKKVAELKCMEVGIDFDQSERAFDMSLYSTFTTKEDLASYAVHPAHIEIVKLIKSVTNDIRVVDYEVGV